MVVASMVVASMVVASMVVASMVVASMVVMLGGSWGVRAALGRSCPAVVTAPPPRGA